MNTTEINYMNELLMVQLVPVRDLKPHEKFCSKIFDHWLEHIQEENYWSHPLLVDKDNLIIMDGHHRYQIAREIKLTYVPCVVVSYNNPYISLYRYRDHRKLDYKQIIATVLEGKLMGVKSTRHKVYFDLPTIHIPLSMLH